MGILGFLTRKKEEKEYFLAWQNAILDKPVNKLIMSKEELARVTKDKLSNDLRILQDSLEIVENTLNPDTFFSRLNLMVEVSNRLQKYEPYLYKKPEEHPVLYFQVIQNYQQFVRRFLLRYYSDTYSKIEKLKTNKGKLNRWEKWYESLHVHYCYMNEENIQLIESDYRLKKNLLLEK